MLVVLLLWAKLHMGAPTEQKGTFVFPKAEMPWDVFLPMMEQNLSVSELHSRGSWFCPSPQGLVPRDAKGNSSWTADPCRFPSSGRRQDPANNSNKICAPFSYSSLSHALARSLLQPLQLASEPWKSDVVPWSLQGWIQLEIPSARRPPLHPKCSPITSSLAQPQELSVRQWCTGCWPACKYLYFTNKAG